MTKIEVELQDVMGNDRAMFFTVTQQEIHYSYKEVKASSWKEALEKARNGQHINEYVEYSCIIEEAPVDIRPTNPDEETDENTTESYFGESEEERIKIRK